MKTFDGIRQEVAQMGRIETIPSNMLVPHYLIHSYLYYELGHSVISDADYDRLARRLDDEWDSVEHIHKRLVLRSNLRTSGFGMRYPLRVVGAATMIYQATCPDHNTTRTTDMPLNARSKGQRGEREIIDMLQPHIDEVSRYNGIEPPILQRNTLQSDRGGFDIVGLDGFAFEVKRVEKDTPGQISQWWDQTLRQAGDRRPVLFYRMNKRPWNVRLLVTMPVGDGRSLRVPADIHFDHFILWFKMVIHRDQLKAKVTA